MYTSFFPNIYYSDSIHIQATTIITGTYSPVSTTVGATTTEQWSISWPYSSTSGTDKLVIKLSGGITCCKAFSSLALGDQY
jgi:hypothetical protein